MKKVITVLILTLTFTFTVTAQDSIDDVNHVNLNWQQNYSKALAKAKAKNKPLLIFFTGSDWCGPCKKLVADFFETQKFKNIADKEFILYEANFPRNRDLVSTSQKEKNDKLKAKFNVTTFPTIVVVDANGNEIGRKKGYSLMRDTSYHYDFINNILNK